MSDPRSELPPDLFDRRLRALRRDRAARIGPELVLHERAFAECLDRLRDIPRSFANALLVGAPDPGWVTRVRADTDVNGIQIVDPGVLFAKAANGLRADEDAHDFGAACFDLVIAVGTLDTVNRLGPALVAIRRAMLPDAPLIGAMAGGDSLPVLRRAMLAADLATGPAAARCHPRIAPATLAGLLSATEFVMPVVDVDRIDLTYGSLAELVHDLRAMGATNSLADRAPSRGREWAERAAAAFAANAIEGRVTERIDLLHFLAWSPPLSQKSAG